MNALLLSWVLTMTPAQNLAIALHSPSTVERQQAISAITKAEDRAAALGLAPLLGRFLAQDPETAGVFAAWLPLRDASVVAPTIAWLHRIYPKQTWGEPLAADKTSFAALQGAAEVIALGESELELVSLAKSISSDRVDGAIANARSFPHARYGALWLAHYRSRDDDASLRLLVLGQVKEALPLLEERAEQAEKKTHGARADKIRSAIAAIK